MYKCYRLVTQHLSSRFCHNSGTKELAKQTMFLTKEKRKEDKIRAQLVAETSGGVRVALLVI